MLTQPPSHKVLVYQAQMAEMQQMQQTFYDLERTHQKIKSQYFYACLKLCCLYVSQV